MLQRCECGILYPGRLALLMQTPQGSCLCAYAAVAWKRGIRNEQLECAIAIELRILDVWFPALLNVPNSSMAERMSARVAVCSCKAFGNRVGAGV